MSSAALSMESRARPSRLIAALLSLIAPGVGHLHAGAPRRALCVFVAVAALGPILVAGALLLPPEFKAIVIYFLCALCALALANLVALIDAARVVGKPDAAPRVRWYLLLAAVLGVWATNCALLSLLPAAKAQMPWRTFTIPSTSMQPTLRINEWLVADTRHYKTQQPMRGDVMVYLLPSDNKTLYIKRIVGLPGDRIAFRDGRAVVNGVMTAEPYADPGDAKAFLNTTAEVTVPAGHVFAAGDNRANSSDSRAKQHGFVPVKNLVARAAEIFRTDDPQRIGQWIGTPVK
jgi:signal peptidase I